MESKSRKARRYMTPEQRDGVTEFPCMWRDVTLRELADRMERTAKVLREEAGEEG